MIKSKIFSRRALAWSNMVKLSGISCLVDGGLPGVAMEIACGGAGLPGGPRIPKRLIADDGSGISCCSSLALSSLSGKVGGPEGFGIGGADGCSIVNPSADGDTTIEPGLDVGWILLEEALDAELGSDCGTGDGPN